jgi:hypothetical protein
LAGSFGGAVIAGRNDPRNRAADNQFADRTGRQLHVIVVDDPGLEMGPTLEEPAAITVREIGSVGDFFRNNRRAPSPSCRTE